MAQAAAHLAQKRRKSQHAEAAAHEFSKTLLQKSSNLLFGAMGSSEKIEPTDLATLDNDGQQVAAAQPHEPRPLTWRRWQGDADWLYQHIYCQVGVAILIFANFIANIIEAQIAINGNTRYEVRIFRTMEMFFFWVFLFELMLNMYSCWFWKFWNSSWNQFDFVVVFITILDVGGLLAPDSPLRYLRMMRAFRVFRLFKRVKSLNKIVVSLGKAMPGVMNAFLILTLVMCIYAILGYEFFHNYPCGKVGGPNSCSNLDEFDDWDKETESPPPRMCAKGDAPGYGFLTECRAQYTFGQEYFGNFLKSFYTLFQVLTGESWSEAIARPLMEQSPMVAAFYFISFILINGIVLVNVVVAVLLEKMVDDEDDDEEEDAGDGAPHHPSIADMYAERKTDRASLDAKLDRLQAQLDAVVAALAEAQSANGAALVRAGALPAVVAPAPEETTAVESLDSPTAL